MRTSWQRHRSGSKLHGGLRGFGVFPVSFGWGIGGAAALAVGGELPTGDGSSVMRELTLPTNLYNGKDTALLIP